MSLLLLGERPTEAMSALPPMHTTWVPDDTPSSPTLSNIDMVLPMASGHLALSPPRAPPRPPSPSYLRDRAGHDGSIGAEGGGGGGTAGQAGGGGGGIGAAGGPAVAPATAATGGATSPAGASRKKERLGLSRKMMMLRSRTSSNGSTVRGSPSPNSVDLVPSSPILQDVGNLAPEQPESDFLQLPLSANGQLRRTSGSSSSELSGSIVFLDKYSRAGVSSDDEALYESSDIQLDSSTSIDDDADALRRRQEQEEYESAILSQRAEQILANAKRRLNVMEGNLRGARDLVQPLTAANLKRATSLSGAAIYGNGRTLRYDYDNEQAKAASPRNLHSQQSSPHMNQDYHRNWSDALPDRPHTSLDHGSRYVATSTLQDYSQSAEQTHGRVLRTARSHDQLGRSGVYSSSRAFHTQRSPDQMHLEPLAEDEERRSQRHSQYHSSSSINNGLGIYRPSSRTSDLRDQMSSLKGKISTLKERAREDSIRRQSQSNLRHQSPFNNAAATPPGVFDARSPVEHHDGAHDPGAFNGAPNGSRKVFAEQATPGSSGPPEARVGKMGECKTPVSKFQVAASSLKMQDGQPQLHRRRTASGSAMVSSSKSRNSHQQYHDMQAGPHSAAVIDLPSAHYAEHEYLPESSPASSANESTGSHRSSSDEARARFSDGYATSEPESSVYEDAKEQASVVAHEDREDAFDYEHFFLHSAMATYAQSESSAASEASIETARGPALVGYEDEEAFEQPFNDSPPTSPETPEKLREIERNLHKRTLSNESITTAGTFATAEEGAEEEPASPIEGPITYRGRYAQRQHSVSPIPSPGPSVSRMHSRQESRNTQRSSSTYRASSSRQSHVQHGNNGRLVTRSDSSSDRADSGVGMMSRSDYHYPLQFAGTRKYANKASNNSVTSTPPLSPLIRTDPTTTAVQALLDPNGRPLGLRNNAVLFSVVESLRRVVRQMQDEDDATFASRMLRNTLDEAKRTLDGL